MKIFSLSLSLPLFPDYTHTHHHFSKLVWRDITRSTTRIPAKSILPRISKPFVYLEPPFHYLETARFFFLSRKREHRKQGGRVVFHRGRGYPFGYLSIRRNIYRWSHDRLRSSFCSFCSMMKRGGGESNDGRRALFNPWNVLTSPHERRNYDGSLGRSVLVNKRSSPLSPPAITGDTRSLIW